jgi:hypothetical protein
MGSNDVSAGVCLVDLILGLCLICHPPIAVKSDVHLPYEFVTDAVQVAELDYIITVMMKDCDSCLVESHTMYGCRTWSYTLREGHRLRVFENSVLNDTIL